MPDNTADLKIVAAALRIGEVTVSMPAPARHHHLFRALATLCGDPNPGVEQGFLASDGQFFGRKMALVIASSANQLQEHKVGRPDELFSEDLW